MSEIIKVTRWRVHNVDFDFPSKHSAELYVASLAAAQGANGMLRDGATLAQIQAAYPDKPDAYGLHELPDSLRHLTTHHRLTIPHWQCKDGPWYRLLRLDVRLPGHWAIYVAGDAWQPYGNAYGNHVTYDELFRWCAIHAPVLGKAS